MTNLLSLPPELLEALCDLLEPDDLKNFGLTCKTIYDIISLDSIWRNMISRKYRIEPDQYPSSTGRAFYQRILHPYAPILGLWLMEFRHYGGLLRVFVENGCTVGEEVFSPPLEATAFQPIVKKRIFRIQPDVDGDEDDVREEGDGAA